MNMKQLFLLSLLVFTSHAYASNTKLTNYEMIKASLTNGSNVKAVVDIKNDCVLINETGDEPKTSPNIFGFMIDKFIISFKNGDIISSANILNAPDEKFPANYNNVEMAISPDNKVIIKSKGVTLPEYRMIRSWSYSCAINNQNNNGIKFYSV